MVETLETPAVRQRPSAVATGRAAIAQPLAAVAAQREQRLDVGLGELARVLGGGLVPGSLVLLGGDPGIGKSTLLLQVANLLAQRYGTVLYVSGEESAQQVRLRGERLGALAERLLILPETDLAVVLDEAERLSPVAMVIDSIQTIYLGELESSAGSVGQLRECTLRLMQFSKARGVATFLIGHVTKEGAIAGPRVLEHMVDAVLYLEGERFHSYRLLRGVKNRFGSTNEVGVFEMADSGLQEVANPSAVFLGERDERAPGSAVVVTLEGTRPLLVEVQALTAPTGFGGLPRRTANGVDLNRLHMLLAVLSKRVRLGLGNQDVYVNVVGGMRIGEPAADLGIAVAIASSVRDRPVRAGTVLVGEVGLGGELRSVGQLDRRLAEAARLGFTRVVAARAPASRRQRHGLQVESVVTLRDALDAALED
jgi:DNA repair protein RadA/Sms